VQLTPATKPSDGTAAFVGNRTCVARCHVPCDSVAVNPATTVLLLVS